ncbi:MAG: hypothetical protein KAJ46_01560 [Sedimentisphaerales bacterium]|nr:hypothetical protein [Sedimentisphaerales bacterium]
MHFPKPSKSPEIKHCFDTVGHKRGSKPWLLGGSCCCTPSEKVLADWQANGYFVGKSVAEVIALYHEKGFRLATDHQNCNNACKYGPHVVKGGKCMVPPTPGTENYEEILFGCVYMTKKDSPKQYRRHTASDTLAYTAVPEGKKK